MSSNRFDGVGVALVTPFKDDKTIDYSALEKHLNYLIDNSIDYLAVLGTTGEPSTLTLEEKKEYQKAVVQLVDKRVPIVWGMGSNNTMGLVEDIKNFDSTGIDAILSISPYYTKPIQKGLFEHFKLVNKAAEDKGLPVILYNVPGRTAMNVNADTILSLANNFKNIIAVKEASGNMNQIMQILKDKPEGFSLISGDDSLTLSMMAMGCIGVISVIANVLPKQFKQMISLCQEGKFFEASQIHFKLLDIMNAMFEEGSPAGAKAALQILGIMKDNVRLPLYSVSDNHKQKIERLLKEIL